MVKLPLLPWLCMISQEGRKAVVGPAQPSSHPLGTREQVRERGVHWASSQEQQRLQGPPCSPALPSLGRLAVADTVCHLRQGCCSVNTGWGERGSHLEQTPASLAVWRPCPPLTACSSRWLRAPWCPLLPIYFASCFILPVLASPLLPRLHLIFPPVQSLLV